MKKLGKGWQYTVYDLNNGRVVKKRNSQIVAYWEMFKSYLPLPKIWMFSRYYKIGTKQAIDSLSKIQATPLDKSLFGNPVILEDGISYEQDKITPLYDYFKNNRLADGYLMIDKFIVLNEILIVNNLIDKSFSIGKNFGVNTENQIILTDLGEIYSHPDSIRKQVKKRAWSYLYVLKGIPNKKLRSYFLQQMDKNFSQI